MNAAPATGRLKRWLILAAALATVGFAIASIAVRVRYGHLGVRARLSDAVADSGSGEVDLGALAAFPWDHLFVFGPYTSRETMKERVDMPSAVSIGVGISRRDDVVLLVFAEGRKYSAHLPFPRNVADLAPAARLEPYARGEARFRIERPGAGAPRLVPGTR